MSFSMRDLSQAVLHRSRHQHGMSRRAFLALAGSGALAIAAGPLARPSLGGNSDPKPIQGGVSPFHVYPPDYKPGGPPAIWEQNTITDFRGGFASTDVTGWGLDQDGRELYFRCDMRAVRGDYVGVDGSVHKGAFGFI